MNKYWLIAGLVLAGCSGSETTQENTKTEAPKAEAKPIKKLNLEELQKAAKEVALVPSPAEMQKSLKNVGLKSNLSSLVNKDRKISMDVEDKDNIAVRTGVVLADLVLTVKETSKEEKIARLEKLKIGFNPLGAGDDIQATIDGLVSDIN